MQSRRLQPMCALNTIPMMQTMLIFLIQYLQNWKKYKVNELLDVKTQEDLQTYQLETH